MKKMKRIMILGSGGAGKSTFARKLSDRLDLEIIHLDRHFWNSNWTQTPSLEWAKKVEELSAREEWIIDGNYSNTIDVRLERADTIIFLDFPRILCLWRVLQRRIEWHGKSRPDMAEGCPEGLDWEFIKWIWRYPERYKPKILEKIRAYEEGKKIFILRSDRDKRKFLENLN